MSTILALMFAQSLFGALGQPEEVSAPVEAKVEALAPVAPVEVASAPEEPAGEPVPASVAEVTVEKAPPASEEPAPAPVPEEPAPAPAADAEEAPPAKPADGAAAALPRSVKITSDRTDYDRREGVIMFDRNVFVDDDEYKMHSDQLYVFLDGTNELKRIVAIGNVSITNETRVGSCAKAAYTKSVGKVVMYGDGGGKNAKLADYGKRKSQVEGRKITFWIDSEQVEVEGSTVTLDAGGFGGKDGARKLLGK